MKITHKTPNRLEPNTMTSFVLFIQERMMKECWNHNQSLAQQPGTNPVQSEKRKIYRKQKNLIFDLEVPNVCLSFFYMLLQRIYYLSSPNCKSYLYHFPQQNNPYVPQMMKKPTTKDDKKMCQNSYQIVSKEKGHCQNHPGQIWGKSI